MQMNELGSLGIKDLTTRPWKDDEYMVVDGLQVVYSVSKKTGGVFVHMPGWRQ